MNEASPGGEQFNNHATAEKLVSPEEETPTRIGQLLAVADNFIRFYFFITHFHPTYKYVIIQK